MGALTGFFVLRNGSTVPMSGVVRYSLRKFIECQGCAYYNKVDDHYTCSIDPDAARACLTETTGMCSFTPYQSVSIDTVPDWDDCITYQASVPESLRKCVPVKKKSYSLCVLTRDDVNKLFKGKRDVAKNEILNSLATKFGAVSQLRLQIARTPLKVGSMWALQVTWPEIQEVRAQFKLDSLDLYINMGVE